MSPASIPLRRARNACRSIWAASVPAVPMGDLHRTLGWRQLTMEGYLGRAQARFLRHLLAENPRVTKILEVGFNAGHSSYLFLSARPDVTVASFDLGAHDYVARAKAFIDAKFPGRHMLVLGNSLHTLAKYRADHENSFDLTFIDGSHDYDIAFADIVNGQFLSKPAGLVVMDDLLQWTSWGAGPVRAWAAAKRQGLVEELQLIQDGRPVTAVRRKPLTNAWAVGRYLSPRAPLPEQRQETRSSAGPRRQRPQERPHAWPFPHSCGW